MHMPLRRSLLLAVLVGLAACDEATGPAAPSQVAQLVIDTTAIPLVRAVTVTMRTAGPAPPRSKPSSLISSKAFCTFSVLTPWNMMSPLWPCSAIRPEPCRSHASQSLRRMSVL